MDSGYCLRRTAFVGQGKSRKRIGKSAVLCQGNPDPASSRVAMRPDARIGTRAQL
ncbi:hypothetical protein FRUB_05715 [Fimbriiglobus ruber]|uniref:Uncharacterized protein n=1 Tax=Fimbriiglobus ruber TaxID=1908690 RepID=A0A225DTX7_9BACT|nr:hypothetical protein FRUB_05715 [Fimbriiglobus ruber]